MAQRLHRWWDVGCVSVDGSQELAKRGGRGLLAGFRGSLPPASEREARMDDPTLRCENDAGNEMHHSGLPIPSGGPIFMNSKFCTIEKPLKRIFIWQVRPSARIAAGAVGGRKSTG